MGFSIVWLLQIWSASRVSCWHYNDCSRSPFVRILNIECVLVPWYFVDWYLWCYCHVSVSVYHRHGDIKTVCFYSFLSNTTNFYFFFLEWSKGNWISAYRRILLYVKSCGNSVYLILSVFLYNGTSRVWAIISPLDTWSEKIELKILHVKSFYLLGEISKAAKAGRIWWNIRIIV